MFGFLKKAASRTVGAAGAAITAYLTTHNETVAVGTFVTFLVYGVVHSAVAPSK